MPMGTDVKTGTPAMGTGETTTGNAGFVAVDRSGAYTGQNTWVGGNSSHMFFNTGNVYKVEVYNPILLALSNIKFKIWYWDGFNWNERAESGWYPLKGGGGKSTFYMNPPLPCVAGDFVAFAMDNSNATLDAGVDGSEPTNRFQRGAGDLHGNAGFLPFLDGPNPAVYMYIGTKGTIVDGTPATGSDAKLQVGYNEGGLHLGIAALTSNINCMAQTFNPEKDFRCGEIKVRLNKCTFNTNDIDIEIRNQLDPSGATVYYSYTIPNAEIPRTSPGAPDQGNFHTHYIPDYLDIRFDKGTEYWLCIGSPDTGGNAHCVIYDDKGTYTGGQLWQNQARVASGEADARFMLYDNDGTIELDP